MQRAQAGQVVVGGIGDRRFRAARVVESNGQRIVCHRRLEFRRPEDGGAHRKLRGIGVFVQLEKEFAPEPEEEPFVVIVSRWIVN
jgi:hypothetical protein